MTDRRKWGISRLFIVLTQFLMLALVGANAAHHDIYALVYFAAAAAVFMCWPLCLTIDAAIRG